MSRELVIESMCFCLTCLFSVSLECIQVWLMRCFFSFSFSLHFAHSLVRTLFFIFWTKNLVTQSLELVVTATYVFVFGCIVIKNVLLSRV